MDISTDYRGRLVPQEGITDARNGSAGAYQIQTALALLGGAVEWVVKASYEEGKTRSQGGAVILDVKPGTMPTITRTLNLAESPQGGVLFTEMNSGNADGARLFKGYFVDILVREAVDNVDGKIVMWARDGEAMPVAEKDRAVVRDVAQFLKDHRPRFGHQAWSLGIGQRKMPLVQVSSSTTWHKGWLGHPFLGDRVGAQERIVITQDGLRMEVSVDPDWKREWHAESMPAEVARFKKKIYRPLTEVDFKMFPGIDSLSNGLVYIESSLKNGELLTELRAGRLR
jgi:hypothetical protein